MDNVGYVALSAQVALRRNLDVVANNVANMNTVGFKADQMLFGEALSRTAGGGDSKNVSFVADKKTWTDFSDGSARQTGSDLNAAIVGKGFFGVQTPDGVTYTRDGRFGISPDGGLVNLSGNPILDADAAPIQLPAGTGSITISKDGTISSNGALVARLGVFDNPAAESMEKRGDAAFVSRTQLEETAFPQAAQGMLEDSNVSGVVEITRLVDVQRAYDQVNNVAEAADGLKKDAISRLGQV